MAIIDKKFIHFKNYDDFISQAGVGSVDNITTPTSGSEDTRNAVYGQIKGSSIVFIKDTKQIWTHGQLYSGNVDISTLSDVLRVDETGLIHRNQLGEDIIGLDTEATGEYSHAEGINTIASGIGSHAEGGTYKVGEDGTITYTNGGTASGDASHAEGRGTLARGVGSHAEGYKTTAGENSAHAEGYETTASGVCSHAEGRGSVASGIVAHAEGRSTTASGEHSHAEGRNTIASGIVSHAEGGATTASKDCAHAEGGYTTASNTYAHAEGYETTASGQAAHTEGCKTQAKGNWTHAEGYGSIAESNGAHAEGGYWNLDGSLAVGGYARAAASHAEGVGTITSNIAEHASGKYNVSTKDETLFSVGNGTSDTDRHNAFEIKSDNTAYVNGESILTVDEDGAVNQTALSIGGFAVVDKPYNYSIRMESYINHDDVAVQGFIGDLVGTVTIDGTSYYKFDCTIANDADTSLEYLDENNMYYCPDCFHQGYVHIPTSIDLYHMDSIEALSCPTILIDGETVQLSSECYDIQITRSLPYSLRPTGTRCYINNERVATVNDIPDGIVTATNNRLNQDTLYLSGDNENGFDVTDRWNVSIDESGVSMNHTSGVSEASITLEGGQAHLSSGYPGVDYRRLDVDTSGIYEHYECEEWDEEDGNMSTSTTRERLVNESMLNSTITRTLAETKKIEEIQYSDLRAKADKGELIPGRFYRITDYETMTCKYNTQSAGHHFDIIVQAIDNKTLSHDAKAAIRQGDSYFKNSKLESWKLQYDLVANSSKYDWIQSDVLETPARWYGEIGILEQRNDGENSTNYITKQINGVTKYLYKVPNKSGFWDEIELFTYVTTSGTGVSSLDEVLVATLNDPESTDWEQSNLVIVKKSTGEIIKTFYPTEFWSEDNVGFAYSPCDSDYEEDCDYSFDMRYTYETASVNGQTYYLWEPYDSETGWDEYEYDFIGSDRIRQTFDGSYDSLYYVLDSPLHVPEYEDDSCVCTITEVYSSDTDTVYTNFCDKEWGEDLYEIDSIWYDWYQPFQLNSKGVIYRMIDEWGNDLPFDFKNIKVRVEGSEYNHVFGLATNDYSVTTSSIYNNVITNIGNKYTLPLIVFKSQSTYDNKIDLVANSSILCASTFYSNIVSVKATALTEFTSTCFENHITITSGSSKSRFNASFMNCKVYMKSGSEINTINFINSSVVGFASLTCSNTGSMSSTSYWDTFTNSDFKFSLASKSTVTLTTGSSYGTRYNVTLDACGWSDTIDISNIAKSNQTAKWIIADIQGIHQAIPESLVGSQKLVKYFSGDSVLLHPDVYYIRHTPIETLVIDIPSLTGDCFCQFTTSDSGMSLSIPVILQWENGLIPEIEANTTYVFKVVSTICSLTKVNNVTHNHYFIYTTNTNKRLAIPTSFVSNNSLYSNIYQDGFGKAEYKNNILSFGNLSSTIAAELTSISIPDTVATISTDSFKCGVNLQAFYGKYASEDSHYLIKDGVLISTALSGVSESTIPTSVSEIAAYAFYNRNSVQSILIPNSVTKIGDYAFYGCTSLINTTIPSSVLYMSVINPFQNCSGTFSINCNIPTNTYSDYSIFQYSKFTTLSVGEDVAYIGTNTLTRNSDLSSITGKFSSDDHRCLIINGVLTAFAPSGLTEYTIPDGVTSIGDYAFSNCTSLTSVTIPDSVTSIGSGAFKNCTSLTSIIIPNSVTSIGHKAFYDCTSLTSVTIGNSVTSIKQTAFAYCDNLTSVTIPDSVLSIGNQAFYSCDNLNEIYLESKVPFDIDGWPFGAVKYIYVYNECVSLYKTVWTSLANKIYANGKSMNMSHTTTIEYTTSDASIIDVSTLLVHSNTYNSGKGLLTVYGDLSKIPKETFTGCNTLTSIQIPNGVKLIGAKSFYNCTALTTINLPNSVIEIGESAFSRCRALTSINIPDNVTYIGVSAFANCSGLTRIDINNTMSWCKIDFDEADSNPLYASKNAVLYLNGASVTEITIPLDVTTLNSYGSRIKTLSKVYCPHLCPPNTSSSSMFSGTSSNLVIYVPRESLEAYKVAKGWKSVESQLVAYDF